MRLPHLRTRYSDAAHGEGTEDRCRLVVTAHNITTTTKEARK